MECRERLEGVLPHSRQANEAVGFTTRYIQRGLTSFATRAMNSRGTPRAPPRLPQYKGVGLLGLPAAPPYTSRAPMLPPRDDADLPPRETPQAPFRGDPGMAVGKRPHRHQNPARQVAA